MCTIHQLERVAGSINLRIHRGDDTNPDKMLLQELGKQGVFECELGDCDLFDDRGAYAWTPFIGVWFIQERSGRCRVIGG